MQSYCDDWGNIEYIEAEGGCILPNDYNPLVNSMENRFHVVLIYTPKVPYFLYTLLHGNLRTCLKNEITSTMLIFLLSFFFVVVCRSTLF